MKDNQGSHWHGWKMAPFQDPDMKSVSLLHFAAARVPRINSSRKMHEKLI